MNYIYPISAMAGSIIGVGIFSLPYVAEKSGIWMMLLYFLVLTFVIVSIHLVFAEISLKTPDLKRFPGFVGHHLGGGAKFLALVTVIFGGFGVLLAYLIVGGEFLANLLTPLFGGNILFYSLLYFILASAIILLGIKTIAKCEFWALVLLLFSFLFIFLSSLNNFNFKNIFFGHWDLDFGNFFLPYGALLFALWGTGMIPQVEEMLENSTGQKKNFKKIIVVSTLIPAFIYILFVFLILGITGPATTESALTGLKNFLPETVFSIALFAGTLATFTAFITQGLILKDVLMLDLGIKKWPAFIIACFTPLVLFLLGLKSFIGLISFTGAILLGLNGILILLMYKKIKGKNYVIYPLLFVFLLGIIYEIFYSIK